ncbi:MAG TPA: hypothetical protein ENJ40_04265 [Thermosulfurimonas dismutans]|uniref:Uncharacterized protein n=1 Tax=Thermosulfurimonas dismutans TaxID=999894 RepID=A0A7C3GKC4_9BACT|nr:hypothetical protein [Thermosulfurimonas dismutans]
MAYLTVTWVEGALERYLRRRPEDTIMGKKIAFSPRHYLAALLHIYTGCFSLGRIARLAGLSEEELRFQRAQIDFMSLVDYLRTRFAEWFREHLLLRDYHPAEYGRIALEYCHLEEQVRSQVRIPLLDQLKHLCYDLEDRLSAGKGLPPYDEHLFRRLLFFFLAAEGLKPTLSSRLVNRARDLAERAYPGEFSRLELPSPEGFSEKLYQYLEEVLSHGA